MRRGDFTGRTAAHTVARTCVDGSTGARTTSGSHVRRRYDRLTHDEVSVARSARRFARGSALARRRRCRL